LTKKVDIYLHDKKVMTTDLDFNLEVDTWMDNDKTAESRTCGNCKHWDQRTFNSYEGAVNAGECTKIREALEIEVDAGWDGGTVGKIETDSDFGCNLFERKVVVVWR